MFAVFKYLFRAYFVPQPSIPCVGRCPYPLREWPRLRPSRATAGLFGHHRYRSPQGHPIQGPPVPTPHADETHPQHRLREPFWVFRLADRAEPQPNPKKQAEATRGSPRGLSTHAGAEFSTRRAHRLALLNRTSAPRADRTSSIVNHFRQFLISSAEVRNIRIGSVTSVSFRAAGLRSKVQRRLQGRSAIPTSPSSDNHCIPE